MTTSGSGHTSVSARSACSNCVDPYSTSMFHQKGSLGVRPDSLPKLLLLPALESGAVTLRKQPTTATLSWCVGRAMRVAASLNGAPQPSLQIMGPRATAAVGNSYVKGQRVHGGLGGGQCHPRDCFSSSSLDRSADQILYRLCWREKYVARCLLIQNMLCPGGRFCLSLPSQPDWPQT